MEVTNICNINIKALIYNNCISNTTIGTIICLRAIMYVQVILVPNTNKT